jgi:xanthine dehydrogenase small subunit
MPLAHIRFLRRGKIVQYRPPQPAQTVLDYIRLVERSPGTKEGCNEGDCGACTVALGSVVDGRMRYEPVNACILLMGQLHGKELITVEDLAKDGALHPVQQAMVACHGSQCGFCTPGFVMALFTLYQSGHRPSRADIVDHLAGNLCRCTGYRPIVEAGMQACKGKIAAKWVRDEAAAVALLGTIGDERVFMGDGASFIAIPRTADDLAALTAQHPDATIVAGATDVGLWITKQFRPMSKFIFLSAVRELHAIEARDGKLMIGAGATYAEAMDHLSKIDPDIGTVMRRLGSTQVRASGTVGGNIANGSPIGDMPPMLIALGATLHLRLGEKTRAMPLEDFFIRYGEQNRARGELVWQIEVPVLAANERFRSYKITKRFDQDISAVMAAFKFQILEDRIEQARVAFGGMAATPKRAAKAELALIGASLASPESWETAIKALADDYAPITDVRASATYRLQTAQNLLRKALTELAGESRTRVTGARLELVQ